MSLLCRVNEMGAMNVMNTWGVVERPKHNILNGSARSHQHIQADTYQSLCLTEVKTVVTISIRNLVVVT